MHVLTWISFICYAQLVYTANWSITKMLRKMAKQTSVHDTVDQTLKTAKLRNIECDFQSQFIKIHFNLINNLLLAFDFQYIQSEEKKG